MQQNTTTKTLFYISAELKNICMYMSKAQSRLAKAKAKTTTRNKFLKIEKKKKMWKIKMEKQTNILPYVINVYVICKQID